jgi:hypothetical protein
MISDLCGRHISLSSASSGLTSLATQAPSLSSAKASAPVGAVSAGGMVEEKRVRGSDSEEILSQWRAIKERSAHGRRV